jgi:uncharacterized protein (TIGR00251 family)
MDVAPSGAHRWQGEDLFLEVRVQPRADRNEIAGLHDARLKIRITATPTDGKANAHLMEYLARQFKVPKSRVQIVAGHSGRNKRIRIHAPKRLPGTLHKR